MGILGPVQSFKRMNRPNSTRPSAIRPWHFLTDYISKNKWDKKLKTWENTHYFRTYGVLGTCVSLMWSMWNICSAHVEYLEHVFRSCGVCGTCVRTCGVCGTCVRTCGVFAGTLYALETHTTLCNFFLGVRLIKSSDKKGLKWFPYTSMGKHTRECLIRLWGYKGMPCTVGVCHTHRPS